MYARLAALVCLLSIGAAGSEATGGQVQFYLKSSGDVSPRVMSEMKADLATLMRSAGLRIGWWSARDKYSGVDGDLIIIDLQGTCDPWAPTSDLTAGKNFIALASTAVADGRVLPFSSVDCTAVNGFLSEALATIPAPRRERVYGRALARLLAHEVFHVMTQSTDHTETGVAKAEVTPDDLIGEHFDFDGFTISKPRPPDQDAASWQTIQELEAGK